MLERLTLLLSIALLTSVCACSTHSAPDTSDIEQRYNTLYSLENRLLKSDDSTRTISTQFAESYDDMISSIQKPHKVGSLATTDVQFLFTSASLAQFYSFNPKYVRDMQLDLNELHRRQVATQADYTDLYAALIGSRMFAEARRLEAKRPLANGPIPDYRDDSSSGSLTDLVVGPHGTALTRQNVSLPATAIVVVVSPLCHFSQSAIRTIESDSTLRPIFRTHALWLVPPDDASTGFDTIADWNQSHPHEYMYSVYRIRDWPMIDRWETPTFYFVKNGKLAVEVVGWPGKGRKPEVVTALKRVNLL